MALNKSNLGGFSARIPCKIRLGAFEDVTTRWFTRMIAADGVKIVERIHESANVLWDMKGKGCEYENDTVWCCYETVNFFCKYKS